jgi:hypothetical protein
MMNFCRPAVEGVMIGNRLAWTVIGEVSKDGIEAINNYDDCRPYIVFVDISCHL